MPVSPPRRLFPWLLAPAAVGAAFLLDGVVTELFAGRSGHGQVNALLHESRTWGEAATLLTVTAALVLLQPHRWRQAVAIALATVAVAGLVDAVKPLTDRPRPVQSRDAVAAGKAHESGRNSSFPSGHTATAFAFGRGLAWYCPPLRPLCLFAASTTAVSRMSEGRHYLSDCVVGGLLGWLLTPWLIRAGRTLDVTVRRRLRPVLRSLGSGGAAVPERSLQ